MKLKYLYLDDQLIVYNSNTMQIFRFKGQAKDAIPTWLPQNYSSDDKAYYVQEMSKLDDPQFSKYMISMVDEYYYTFDEKRETVTISFAPIHQCNMRCRYCFANGGENYAGNEKEMKEETLRKVFEFVLRDYAPECKFLLVSLVSGGEPFLNLDLITKINTIIDSFNPEIKRKIFIGTNMTLYNDEIKRKLQEINPQLGVSIDGPESFHDRNRKYLNGDGSYETVVNNLKKIKEDPDLSIKSKNCIFMTVITEENLNLVEILKHHKKLGATSVQIRIARSKVGEVQGVSEDNVEKFISAYEELFHFFVDEFRQGRVGYLNMILNSTDYFGKYVKRLMLKEMTQYRCGAGKDKLTFTANGDVYPCDSFVGNKEFLLGNIYEDKELKLDFSKYTIFNNEQCGKCWARMICTGDCLFNSLARTGKIDMPDAVMCKLYKKMAEFAVLLVAKMQMIDSDRYYQFLRMLEIREKNNNIM